MTEVTFAIEPPPGPSSPDGTPVALPPVLGARHQSPTIGSKARFGVNRRAPIWVGSPHTEEIVTVKDIQQVDVGAARDVRKVHLIENLEKEANLHETAGRYIDAAESLEEAIELRQSLLGQMHREYSKAIERYIVLCLSWAKTCLGANQYTLGLIMLKKAESMTDSNKGPVFSRRMELRIETLNHICCYFYAKGKFNAAMQYAEKALRLSHRQHITDTVALIELNCAALLSLLDRHADSTQKLKKSGCNAHRR